MMGLISDAETYDLFSSNPPLADLGMLDPKADEIEINISGRDFLVNQSPGLLQSKRDGGTTGAAVWRTSVCLGEWLLWPKNPLVTNGILGSDKTVLELGSGISGVIPSILGAMVGNVIATDQKYTLKALQENIKNNSHSGQSSKGGDVVTSRRSRGSGRALGVPSASTRGHDHIRVVDLDWEKDDIPSAMAVHGLEGGVDVIFACDCIFNYALIEPFVQTCVDICRQRDKAIGDEGVGSGASSPRTLCMVAQQLRQADVFEQWLQAFSLHFHVWRVTGNLASEGLREGSGFVMHVGLLRS